MTRQEIEKDIFEKIIESIGMDKPANEWVYTYKNIHDNYIYTFIRRDGLEISFTKSTYRGRLQIIKPVNFSFEDWRFENDLAEAFSKFVHILKQDMERKILRDKLDRLTDFFDLDLKKQRKNKLNKINENENR